MKFLPHNYQRYCIQYIKDHPVAALFLDMGLGKTVITLTALKDLMFDEFAVFKPLVIAPLRVTRVWQSEVQKWDHLKCLNVSLAVGDRKTRIAALNKRAFIYVMGRDTVTWLVDYYRETGRKWDFDMVVLDELSSFKSHQSQRFRSLRKVRPYIKRMVGLTGTPAGNGLMGLWSEIGILDGGERLGKFISHYRDAYFRPGSYNPQTKTVFQYVPIPGAEKYIYKRISDITVSMKAKDYINIPDCLIVDHEAVMSDKERKLYDTLKTDLVLPLEGGDIDALSASGLSNKLLQMANGAVYDENNVARIIHNRKLEMLEDLIEAANGQNVLVAYWFKHDRDRIMKYLTNINLTPRDIRKNRDIDDWNTGNIPVGLIHPASAGHGLNIQDGGHILIWFGLTWSLELYQQTNSRLWRQGQKEVVTIHHIICKNTIDNAVLAALKNKDTTQEKLIAAVKAQLR